MGQIKEIDDKTRELLINAVDDNLDEVQDFVNDDLRRLTDDMRLEMIMSIAVEEIFVNVSHYAYEYKGGDLIVRTYLLDDPRGIKVVFEDGGPYFDPLKKPDPDVTLDVEQREIGGLGIFMVKKTMDEVSYRRENGENILTIRKKLS